MLNSTPTPPIVVLGLLAVCLPLYFYSPHKALLFFTFLLGCLLLGSLIGCCVFVWKLTMFQVLLTLAMIAEVAYGWSIQSYYIDD